jgi:flagellar biosynthesis/type III secretory pathway chaperone
MSVPVSFQENRFVDASVCREHLAKLINEESKMLARLEDLLSQEHEYLVANDIEALDRAGDARQACISELVRVDDDRRTLCRMLNMPTDNVGIERMLNWCDPTKSLQPRIADCAVRAGRCRESNDRNGALVTARLKRVEGLLDVVTGRANQPKVYARQGGYEAPGRTATVLAKV